MKILFLDFDGVLHPYIKRGIPDEFCLLPYVAKLIADNPEVVVVLTTAWREPIVSFDPETNQWKREECFSFEDLCELVAPIKHKVIGLTPILPDNNKAFGRLWECLKWLEDNGHQNTEWRALDDQRSLFELDAPCPNLILCDETVGFTEDSLAFKALQEFVSK